MAKEYRFQIEAIFRSGRKVLTDPEVQSESEIASLVQVLERFAGSEMTKCSLTGVKVRGVLYTNMSINPKELESISVILLSGPGVDD